MADTLTSLADMVKLNDVSVRDMGVTDIFNEAPLLAALHSIEASHGTDHKFLKETGSPAVGFRAANAGIEWKTDADTLVTIALKILDASFGIDRALVDNASRGGSSIMMRKARRHLRAAFAHAELQLLYGDGSVDANDSDGFQGLADVLNDTADAMVIAADGTADRTSVWAIRTVSDESAACVVVGNDGMIDIPEYYPQDILDSSSKHFPGYHQPIQGYIGYQFGSAKSAARLGNIGSDGTGLTDDYLSNLYELFPAKHKPTHFCMNVRSQMQLQRSRTTYSPTGAEAPLPTSWNGVNFVITDNLGNAETALTATPIADT
jgi:hypothetical protein